MKSDIWPDYPVTNNDLWTVHRGASAVIGTAIHNGHGVRAEAQAITALSDEQRLREEDPFTEYLIRDMPNRIVVHRSRFEVDLNRARNEAIYLTPEQSWGLSVWQDHPPQEVIADSLNLHDDYYEMLALTLRQMERHYGAFAMLDVHSYNHRREGPDAPATSLTNAPDINIGTFSMDRDRWSHVISSLMDHLSVARIAGRKLDVRENIAFQGKGEQTRFVHHTFPLNGCAIAIEFKKIFMDEWTGEPNWHILSELRSLMATTVPVIERALGEAR